MFKSEICQAALIKAYLNNAGPRLDILVDWALKLPDCLTVQSRPAYATNLAGLSNLSILPISPSIIAALVLEIPGIVKIGLETLLIKNLIWVSRELVQFPIEFLASSIKSTALDCLNRPLELLLRILVNFLIDKVLILLGFALSLSIV